ncbi:transporter substrate-binding domain-containing protein [Bradyrhizobium barranii subsp. apii]|uniref:transporter substrate-binding domain-containing protein n=1 Tax=Bradyrhizobium barranii TaxID=2992140 RepID=UPI001CD4ECA6|nr:transporter substrate-binding domain-containing protein [Bradyrhizobium barranii]UPT93223.1 transporter substrate-binding domain-containing protein [Bradyrhizobium barranii subsp. apii]
MTFRAALMMMIATIISLDGLKATHADDGRLAELRASGTMRVGVTLTSAPWTYLGSDNKAAGYDVEIAKEVGQRLGIANVVFIGDSFKNFIEGLRANKYDAVFNDLTPTPERAKLVDFAEAYGVEDFRIFVKTGNTSIKGLDDLKGRTVGVTTGTTNESWARANIPQAKIAGYENGSFIFQDLGFGRVEATIISHFGGLRYAQATNLGVIEIGGPLTYQLSAPAIRKGETALKAAIDKAILEMIADGTIDRLGEKIIGHDYKMSEAIAKAKAEQSVPKP